MEEFCVGWRAVSDSDGVWRMSDHGFGFPQPPKRKNVVGERGVRVWPWRPCGDGEEVGVGWTFCQVGRHV